MSAKWDALCAKYKHFRLVTSDKLFRAGRLSFDLKKAIVRACQCAPDSVRHYRYEIAAQPEWDQSEPVDSGYDSPTKTEDGWALGFGIQLEISATTYPKTMLIWPVEASFKSDSIILTSPMFDGEIVLRDASYQSDLTEFGNAIYEGLGRTLDTWAAGTPPNRGIGFHTI